MPFQTVRDRYVNDGAGVVSQNRLLIMLFDRLVLDVQQAQEAMGINKLDVASDCLCHAQAILLELHYALDKTAWDGAAQLDDLYLWMHNELMAANVRKDVKSIGRCLRMLRDLQEAWTAAYKQVSGDA